MLSPSHISPQANRGRPPIDSSFPTRVHRLRGPICALPSSRGGLGFRIIVLVSESTKTADYVRSAHHIEILSAPMLGELGLWSTLK
jgi:hypothetical protein